MQNYRFLVLMQLTILMAFTSSVHASPKIEHKQNGSFGVFEIVACSTTGSKSMVLQTKEGKPETYCIAPAPIVTRTHVKKAENCPNSLGNPEVQVALTQDGAKLMEEATKRISDKLETKGQTTRLGIVMNGKLIDAPTVRGVIRDEFVVSGGISQGEADALVMALGGSIGCRKVHVN